MDITILQTMLAIALSVSGALFAVVGWNIRRTMVNIEHAIDRLSKGLNQSSIEFAGFAGETRTTLSIHEKRLDLHDEKLMTIGAK